MEVLFLARSSLVQSYLEQYVEVKEKNEEMYFSHFEEIIQIARYLFNANTFLTHLVEILCFSVLLAGQK